MQYKSEYIPGFCDGSKKDHYAVSKDEQMVDDSQVQVQQTMENLH